MIRTMRTRKETYDVKNYDDRHRSPMEKYSNSLWKPFLATRIKRLSSGVVSVDVGCGTGEYTKEMAGARKITGIDISPGMISFARKKMKSAGVKATFILSDAQHMPIAANSVDFVSCIGLLEYVDPRKTLAECRRILKPGGKMLVVAPNKWNPYIIAMRINGWMKGTHDKKDRSVGEIVSVSAGLGMLPKEAGSFAVVTYCPARLQGACVILWKLLDAAARPLGKKIFLGKNFYIVLEKK